VNLNESLVIYGFGLIGKQRLEACIEAGWNPSNIIVFDPAINCLSYQNQYQDLGIHFTNDPVELDDFKLVRAIVAVPHYLAAKTTSNLLDRGIKVLLEKPLGRNLDEAAYLAGNRNSHNLSLGFNYRFMPGVIALKHSLSKGELGTISTLRMDLGHGGSPKDFGSWKLNLDMAGGGVFLDPGIHLIDLLIFLLSAKENTFQIAGTTKWKGFWNTGIEESVSIIGNIDSTCFNISVSIVAWRTRFHLEAIGTDGYFEVDGRGRTDGPQITTKGEKWGWVGGKSQQDSEFKEVVATIDKSLIDETKAWLLGNGHVCSIDEAFLGMKLYNKIIGH
jgi:predicted dehydrogenase